jgi:hypothetical protein
LSKNGETFPGKKNTVTQANQSLCLANEKQLISCPVPTSLKLLEPPVWFWT